MRISFVAMTVCVISAVAVAASVGCGRTGLDTVPVTGVVTLDGAPVEGARVVFSPTGGEARAASGTTDSSGRFTLTTIQPRDGAIPGSYQVGVSKVEGGSDTPDLDLEGLSEEEATARAAEAYYGSEAARRMGDPRQQAAETVNHLPARYRVPDESGFTADVERGATNHFEFHLES